MSIPSKQIGWSEKANLYYEIIKKLDRLIKVYCTCYTVTTTTTLIRG